MIEGVACQQRFQESKSLPQRLPSLLYRSIHQTLHYLMPEVRSVQLLHAPHSLLQLPLYEVLLHQRVHALLQLLHRVLRPCSPHVHYPRAAVLLKQRLHAPRYFLPPLARHQPVWHERDEVGRKNIVHDRPRDEVGEQRRGVGRVQRQVV